MRSNAFKIPNKVFALLLALYMKRVFVKNEFFSKKKKTF